MPTFIILKSSHETKRIQGANPKKLQDAVQQLAREAESVDSAGSSSAAAAGSSAGAMWLGADIRSTYSDVTDQVDVRGLDLLNHDSGFGNGRTLFDTEKPSQLEGSSKGEKDWVESDTDEQLMLYVPFNSTVKVHSLQLTSMAAAGSSDVMRPKTIKMFQNSSHNLGFDEAEDLEPTQMVELKESDWDSKTHTATVELRFVKFQKCSSLVVFVVNGDGDAEKTRIDRVRVIGEAGEKKSMGKLEKVGHED